MLLCPCPPGRQQSCWLISDVSITSTHPRLHPPPSPVTPALPPRPPASVLVCAVHHVTSLPLALQVKSCPRPCLTWPPSSAKKYQFQFQENIKCFFLFPLQAFALGASFPSSWLLPLVRPIFLRVAHLLCPELSTPVYVSPQSSRRSSDCSFDAVLLPPLECEPWELNAPYVTPSWYGEQQTAVMQRGFLE